VILGRTGRDSCREYRVVNLDVREAVFVESRGRNDDSIDRVVACMADIVATKFKASKIVDGVNWYFLLSLT